MPFFHHFPTILNLSIEKTTFLIHILRQSMKAPLFILFSFFLFLNNAQNQEKNLQLQSTTSAATTTAVPAADEPLNFQTFVERTGIMAYPLILLSLFAAFLILFYVLTIRQGTVVSDSFMNAAEALIRKQDYLGLIAICNRNNECIAHIISKTLDFATRNPMANFEEVKEVTEAEGNRQANKLMARIAYLGDVGSVAPMLGLLGTTIGMITTFGEISKASYGGRSQLGLAQGVHEALLCTASGLVIGIPALIFYALFRGKVNRLISDLESATTHLLALLSVQYKSTMRAQPNSMSMPSINTNEASYEVVR
jgi:biopolymer transport protein ExbB